MYIQHDYIRGICTMPKVEFMLAYGKEGYSFSQTDVKAAEGRIHIFLC